METVKIMVPVTFTGSIEVEVPTDVPQERRDALARKVVLARVLATTDNPGGPGDDACAAYMAESGLDEAVAGWDWNACKTAGVGGKWSLQTDDADSAVVKKLAEKAASAGLQPEDLDETVHDLTSGTAADINNGGLDVQVRYLVKEMGAQHAEDQIHKLIAEK